MWFLKIQPVLLLSIIALFSSCNERQIQVFQRKQTLMDSYVSISIYAENEPPNWQKDINAAFEKIKEIELRVSSHNKNSEIGQINALAGSRSKRVHPQTASLLNQAIQISHETAGAFDPTVWPLRQVWAFSAENPEKPSTEALLAAQKLVDYHAVEINENEVSLPKGAGLDLGAIAKGYAVDVAIEYLRQSGYEDFMVEAGGDLRAVSGSLTSGSRTIWIQHPRKHDAFFASIKMDSGAVATSGDYERFFEETGKRYHHILDPRTGYPARPVVSVTIFANTTELADAFSTAVFVLGLQEGMGFIEQKNNIEGLIVYQDNDSVLHWKVSSGIRDKLQILEK